MLGVPSVIWRDPNGNERGLDITSRLLRDRIILLNSEINEEIAESIIAQLLYLEAEDKEKPIKMLINSPGGSCTAGLSIISVMETISCPVHTTITGLAASMGIVIAASGEKGHRSVYPLSRIMVHQCSGTNQGNVQDVRTSYKEMEKINDILMEQLAKCCGKTAKQVREDCQRDAWYSPKEIIDYGLMDNIVQSRKQKAVKKEKTSTKKK